MADSYTIIDLGKAWKNKYPGEYNDVSDADMGRAVKNKFPGEYDDFVEAPATTDIPPGFAGKLRGVGLQQRPAPYQPVNVMPGARHPGKFTETLVNDVGSLPLAAYLSVRHPVTAIDQMLQGLFNIPEAAGELYKKGDWE